MKRLLVIAGPTAIGKTAHAVRLALELDTEIISCDSRQFYREMCIGVARPSNAELQAVPHHFIACRSVTEPYNIYDYSQDAMHLLERLFQDHDTVIAVGGSGLYIDALRGNISRLPNPTPELRARLQAMPLEEKRFQLRLLDPDYYSRVDLHNPVRLQRALEVCLMTGRPYSEVIAQQSPAQRPFKVEIQMLEMDRNQLRQRIDQRVDLMMQEGLLEEVRSLLPYRHLNTLQTVGYRELFPVIDGTEKLDDAVAAIKLNTWHYARKQLTWMQRYR